VTTWDDPVAVAEQYRDEANLRARQALWANVEGENAPVVLRRVLASLEPTNILEIGGGQGELAEWMQGDLGARVTFVDQSERMVELARRAGSSTRVWAMLRSSRSPTRRSTRSSRPGCCTT
jgi:2-polyprenyl-3-methyl-5-hydroxy-6-metoxy-1,4-benzoquinol methylase